MKVHTIIKFGHLTKNKTIMITTNGSDSNRVYTSFNSKDLKHLHRKILTLPKNKAIMKTTEDMKNYQLQISFKP